MNDDERAEGTQPESSGGAGAHPHRPTGGEGGDDERVVERHEEAAQALREGDAEADSMDAR